MKTPALTGHANTARPQVKHARAPKVELAVTTEHIETSTKADSSHCMIADAIKAAVPNAARVSVDLQTIRFSDPGKRRRYVYLTPRTAQEALIEFDQGRTVEPFQVLLRGAHVIAMPAAPGERRGAAEPGQRRQVVDRGSASRVPEVVGGKAPPLGALASKSTKIGRRRQFGLRAMER
jgi:hypothetical protein